ncbi:hypothetical protein P7K49_035769 [Saguinus oedipus]|uniref:Uncharacterized protein n=1 Tax=Saguinus oedipus TaxID=9490 RepID=A0ABQ9TNK5_SAGOE|nr:hypothetical protein P7K49_035769 [Saguinus oedipus]
MGEGVRPGWRRCSRVPGTGRQGAGKRLTLAGREPQTPPASSSSTGSSSSDLITMPLLPVLLTGRAGSPLLLALPPASLAEPEDPSPKGAAAPPPRKVIHSPEN